jgi:hypothetical protein
MRLQSASRRFFLGIMNRTEEMLAVALERLAALEASQMSLLVMAFHLIAGVGKRSLREEAKYFAAQRVLTASNQLASLAVQFPEFEKFFRDHISVEESDAKDFIEKYCGDGTE